MTDHFPLPPELRRLEQELATRSRGQPSAQLKERCLGSLRIELRRQQASSRWAFAVGTAATVLVGLNLSLSASQATDYGLRPGGRQQSVNGTTEEIRRVLPDIPAQEAKRQALLLQASHGLVLCPNVPAKYMSIEKYAELARSDF
jgi:hypothetical protein